MRLCLLLWLAGVSSFTTSTSNQGAAVLLPRWGRTLHTSAHCRSAYYQYHPRPPPHHRIRRVPAEPPPLYLHPAAILPLLRVLRGGGVSTTSTTSTARKASSFDYNSNSPEYIDEPLPPLPPGPGPGGGFIMRRENTPPQIQMMPPISHRIRIDAFDSMRFFLILNVVLGHFIMFANPSDFLFRLVSQHNAIVGAFFALSGYVAAYTSTEIGERAPSPKLIQSPSPTWIVSRIFGYYPLHLLVLLIFSPMFVFVDMTYNGVVRTVLNGILSVTLTQAWFPMSAETWNAPTWYLSALNFITALMPFALIPISTMTKPQLRRTLFWLFTVNVLPKIGYWWDYNTWELWEGITPPKLHPNYSMFNVQRFTPLLLVAEVLLGAVACRLVMLDFAVDASDPGQDPERPPYTNALSTIMPLSLIGLGLWARAAGWVPPMSDLLFRSFWFVPLFLRLLMATHRNTIRNVKDPLIRFLNSSFWVNLGQLSFPIYIVHGPIGQVFFKKMVATQVFGRVLRGPQNFCAYLLVTLLAALALQRGFLHNRDVAYMSGRTARRVAEFF